METIDLIMLPSISCVDFNLIDPIEAYDRVGIPIIVNPKELSDDAVERALIRLFTTGRSDYEE